MVLKVVFVNVVQKKLMKYHHGYFMAISLLVGLLGVVAKIVIGGKVTLYDILAVIGALILGYGTGRCDQKACS